MGDFPTFLDAITSKLGDKESRDGIGKIFALFDDDDSGSINLQNLKRVARELGETMTAEELEKNIGCKLGVDGSTRELGFSTLQMEGTAAQKAKVRAIIQGKVDEQNGAKAMGKGKPPNLWPKKPKQPAEEEPEDKLWTAVDVTLSLAGLLEEDKLFKTLMKCTRNASKHLNFGKRNVTWKDLIAQYSNELLAALHQAYGEREWFSTLDLAPLVGVATKELIPERFFTGLDETEFMEEVQRVVQQAFEVQRFLPLLWDLVKNHSGPKEAEQSLPRLGSWQKDCSRQIANRY